MIPMLTLLKSNSTRKIEPLRNIDIQIQDTGMGISSFLRLIHRISMDEFRSVLIKKTAYGTCYADNECAGNQERRVRRMAKVVFALS